MLIEGTSTTESYLSSLATTGVAGLDTIELYAFVLLLGYLLHVFAVAGLFIRRGHPAWLGLAYGLLPGLGLVAGLALGDASRLRQQEREGLHLVAAAQTSTQRSRFFVRVMLLVGIAVFALLLLERQGQRLDLTEGQRYTLDPVSQRLLTEISRYEPTLRVRYYHSPADVRPQRFATLPREMRELLEEYARHGGERFEYRLIEVPQLGGHEAGEEPEEQLDEFGLLGLEIETEEDEDQPEGPEREQLQILREVRDLGIQPIHDEVVDGGRTEQLRYYSALHVSYGRAGDKVLDEITVSRQRAEAGQRAVDVANWELTRSIVTLMDRSINLAQPFQIRTFSYDGRVRLAGVEGFASVGEELTGEDGRRYRLLEVDADERRILLEPLEVAEGEEAEPVEVVRMPTFRYRIGLLDGHGERHDYGMSIQERYEDLGFEVTYVDPQGGNESIPEDIDVLLMTSSAEALPEKVRYHVDQFLMHGGRILYTYSAMDLPEEAAPGQQPAWRHTDESWSRFAEAYGAAIGKTYVEPLGLGHGEHFVFDNQCFRIADQGVYWPLAIHLRPENLSDHPLRAGVVASESVEDHRLRRLWLYGVPVGPREPELAKEVRFREALRSSDAAWLQAVNYDILRDPFGIGTPRNPGRNPHLGRLMVRERSNTRSFPLAGSLEGRFTSAFAGEPVPQPLRPAPEGMPEDFDFRDEDLDFSDLDGQGQPEADEPYQTGDEVGDGASLPRTTPENDLDQAPQTAEDVQTTEESEDVEQPRLERAIAEGRIMIFGSSMIYPISQPLAGTDEFMENALLYLIPEGEELLALKAKTTAYTPIEAALTENDRTWYTAMVTLMVPIGLLIVAVLVMLAERAEQMFFRARQQARRRGTAATSPFSSRELAWRQITGGVLVGLGLLMVMLGAFGWTAAPRSSVLWLLAFVLALPLIGTGLEQLTAMRRRDEEHEGTQGGFAYGLVPLGLGFLVLAGGLAVLQLLEVMEGYRTALIGVAGAAGGLALLLFVVALLVPSRRNQAAAASASPEGSAYEADGEAVGGTGEGGTGAEGGAAGIS